MPIPRDNQHPPVMEAHLLATVDYHRCVELQKRLVYESGGRTDGQITLLLCEHASIITVGRAGSPGEIHIGTAERRSRQLDVQWVNRGGGCMVHAPGQLAVYPIVPLSWHEMSVGRYLDCLQKGLLAALAELGIRGRTEPGRYGIWVAPANWPPWAWRFAIGLRIMVPFSMWLRKCNSSAACKPIPRDSPE